jgi:hypothetical protein
MSWSNTLYRFKFVLSRDSHDYGLVSQRLLEPVLGSTVTNENPWFIPMSEFLKDQDFCVYIDPVGTGPAFLRCHKRKISQNSKEKLVWRHQLMPSPAAMYQ